MSENAGGPVRFRGGIDFYGHRPEPLFPLSEARLVKAEILFTALPGTEHPETLKEAVEEWGKQPQVDMAIEEMSELTKALVKERRALHRDDPETWKETVANISEETADVIIMLMQLLEIFENRDDVQRAIDYKVERLAGRLQKLKSAAAGAAQEVISPAT